MKSRRIALVVTELSELNLGSPAGRFHSGLLKQWSKSAQLTVIYSSAQCPEDARFHDWQDYFSKKGIHLVSIREPQADPIGTELERRAQAILNQLRDAQFDAVYFQDSGAPGFFCVQAKKVGLAFLETELCVLHDRPLEFELEATDRLCSSFDDLQRLDLERRTFEGADQVLSTQDGFQWAQRSGWKVPSRHQVCFQGLKPSRKSKPASKSKTWIFQDPFISQARSEQVFDQICTYSNPSDLEVIFWISRPALSQLRTQNRLIARLQEMQVSFQIRTSDLDSLGTTGTLFEAQDLGFLTSFAEVKFPLPKAAKSAAQNAKKVGKKKAKSSIAVCIAHRNRPHFLEIALHSLFSQTYRPDEIIVVDDASDMTSAKAYLNELEGLPGIQVIRQPKRKGPEAARNLAARIARSEFLLFMDDDNVAKPNEVEVLLDVQARTKADVLVCGLDRFFGDAADAHLTSKVHRWLPTSGDLNQALMLSPIGDTNSLFRKATFLELNGFDENPEFAWEDFDLFLRAILAGKNFQTCPEALCWYRRHAENRTFDLPVPATLKHRLKTLPKIAGQDLRPYFSLFHGMMDQDRERTWQITDRRVVSPDRTDVQKISRDALAQRWVMRDQELRKLEVQSAFSGFREKMLQLKPAGKDPRVLLPCPKKFRTFKLRVDIHAAQDSWLGFRYQSDELTSGPVTQERRLKKGANLLEFQCDRPSEKAGDLQMLMASDGTALRIRAIEYLPN
ncbi:MAG: glycosyltransferase family 2 protein [Bdellovibrionales bacterium]|nr:glycosyltransferase family 2 protein [Bdellovibrionales bacterium]